MKGIGIPVADERGCVQDDPQRNDNRLADDVLGCSEEARSLFRCAAKSVLSECAV
jgi:hypothetical protein